VKGSHILIEEIRAARLASGWSRKTLAERVKTSPQMIQRLENGIGSVKTLVAVMAALDFQLAGLGPGTTLAEALRNRRQKRKWSLDKLAMKTGLSRTTIASLERGGGSVASLMRLLVVLAPNVKRRAPERAYWGQGDKVDRDSRFTPPEFMSMVYEAFGPVDIDPCAHRLSPVCATRRIMLEDGGDGLRDAWSGKLAYVNPPYSQMLRWLRRAHEQWQEGKVASVVCLVPVRTDSSWFHEVLSVDADIYLLQGRVRFLDTRGKGQQTPFSLMMVALGVTREQKLRFAQLATGQWLPGGQASLSCEPNA